MKAIWCWLFHSRKWRTRIVGLYDCEVECSICGREWKIPKDDDK